MKDFPVKQWLKHYFQSEFPGGLLNTDCRVPSPDLGGDTAATGLGMPEQDHCIRVTPLASPEHSFTTP